MNRTVAVLLDLYPVFALVGGLVVVAVMAYAVFRPKRPYVGGPARRRSGYYPPPPDKREWMLWVGDGMAPAGPHMIGWPVNIGGRTGKVVDATLLQIQVEWD